MDKAEEEKRVLEGWRALCDEHFDYGQAKSHGPSWAWYRKGEGFFHFRLFGYGVLLKDFRKRRLLFSEREFVAVGKPILIVGYWIVKWLGK